jgi:Zn-dependent protease
MFRFRLFGYDVDVQFFFLFSALFVSGGLQPPYDIPLILVNVVMVFIAVLSHELGHAFVMTRYGLDPSISLAGFGGHTTPNTRAPTTRPQQVLISLAGPFAGFLQAGLLYALFTFAPGLVARMPGLMRSGLFFLLEIDLIWSLFNLIPSLPLDGGRVLESALGPQRAKIAVSISLGVAVLAGGAFAYIHQWYAAILFGLFAFQNYQRFQVTPATPATRERPARERDPEEMPAEAAALLQSAKVALVDDDIDRALTLSRRVIEGDDGSFQPTPKTRQKAFEVVAWALLQKEDFAGATDALAEARRAGEPDAALVGALAFAKGENAEAVRVLEAARKKGDERREVVGPLVQALLALGEFGRAASAALAIVDQLSAEDVRKMAGIAFEAGAFESSGRLCEALFARTRLGDDAYEAARGFAKEGDVERATDMLKRAVDAGFSDRARAWSDAALEALRAGTLGDVLPRP